MSNSSISIRVNYKQNRENDNENGMWNKDDNYIVQNRS